MKNPIHVKNGLSPLLAGCLYGCCCLIAGALLAGCDENLSVDQNAMRLYALLQKESGLDSFAGHRISRRDGLFVITYKFDTAAATFENHDSVAHLIYYFGYMPGEPGKLSFFKGANGYEEKLAALRKVYGRFVPDSDRAMLDTTYHLIDMYVRMQAAVIDGTYDNVIAFHWRDELSILYVPDIARVDTARYNELNTRYSRINPQWFYRH